MRDADDAQHWQQESTAGGILGARLRAEERGTGVHESYTMAGERLLGLNLTGHGPDRSSGPRQMASLQNNSDLP